MLSNPTVALAGAVVHFPLAMGPFSDAELATEVGVGSVLAGGDRVLPVPGALVLPAERLGRVTLLGLGLCLLGGVAAFGGGDGMLHQRALGGALIAAGLPLVPLALGLRLGAAHRRTPLLFLFGVPLAVGLGALLRPGVQPSAVVFWVIAVTLLSFLLESARLFAPGETPALPVAPSGGTAKPVPSRVLRRVRMYRVLQVAAALAFAIPLGIALAESGPPLFAVATAGLLGAVASRAFFIDPLDRHLQRDPALEVGLARLRRHARKGRPARVFYVAAGFALLGMILFVSRRYLAGLGLGPP